MPRTQWPLGVRDSCGTEAMVHDQISNALMLSAPNLCHPGLWFWMVGKYREDGARSNCP